MHARTSRTLPPAPPISFDDVAAAARRLEGVAHRTPVLTSRTIDARTGATVFFKCENLQRVGAFKFRGAYNALSLLDAETRARGVLTFSSGNHAQAIALAGQLLGIPTTVIMPSDAPAVKVTATRGYGAEVILYDRAETTREELGRSLSESRGLPIIPPYDHLDVVAGQGTAVMELLDQAGPLDYVLTPCGGGGLLSGSALAARALAPACRVVGVEPARADDAARSFQSGTLQTVHNPDTLADGARTPSLGTLTFPLVLHHVDDMVTVGEAAIVRSMFYLWERMKLIVEPTGVLAAAAVLEGVLAAPGARIGVVLTGGNVDLRKALSLFERLEA